MTAQPEPPLVKFAREYGWRAYAIPVLLVITIWVVVDVLRGGQAPDDVASPRETVAVTSAEPVEHSRGSGPNPAESSMVSQEVGALPAGGSFTHDGRGTFRVVGSPGAKVGEGREKAITYVVEVEDGVDTSSYGGDGAVATMIDATLANPKGWIADKAFSFQHVAPGEQPNMRIQLASISTTHKACGNDLQMETSCFTADNNRVILNESRWVRGATTAQGDIGSYRQYLINHEVGHGLGYAEHAACTKAGDLAPIMMQQTLSLNNTELHRIDPKEVYPDNGFACSFNPWPFPRS